MERSKYILITILMVICLNSVRASYKADIYNAYINNKMDKWKNVIDEMSQEKIKSNEFILELLNYQYGYIAWCVGNDKDKLANEYLELGYKNIKILEQNGYKTSYVNSYKSAFYGFRIGLNTFSAPFLGPKSVDCAELAMKQDEKNPYGYIQYGNSQYHMPAIFGGSKAVALEYFKKAELLFASDENQIREDWNYLSLLTMIAKTYTELKNYTSAKSYYEKILRIEPGYSWVKNELYPELLKKIK